MSDADARNATITALPHRGSGGTPGADGIGEPAGDGLHRFTHHAMACMFEWVLVADDALYAGQAAQAAFDEVDRLEALLSRFVPHSELSQINALSPGEAVRVGPELLDCIMLACDVYAATGGAFDIAYGSQLATDTTRSGMECLGVDPSRWCIGVTEAGVRLDLGGIGKGYALDRAADVVRDWGIHSARLHAGQSTVLGIGVPAGHEEGWPVALRDPEHADAAPLAQLHLRNQAISGSDVIGQGEHILDPRTGKPASGKLGAWALADSAAVSDALSTAFLILSADEVAAWCGEHPDTGTVLLWREGQRRIQRSFGRCG